MSRAATETLQSAIHQWLTDTPFFNANSLTSVSEAFFLTRKNLNTRRAYFQAIKAFFDKHPILDLGDITTAVIQTHLNLIGDSPPPPPGEEDPHGAARALALAALRQFFRYLQRKKQIAENPAEDASVNLTSRLEGKTQYLTLDEFHTLLAHIGAATPRDRRDRALVAFLGFTGSRITAALKLTHGSFQEGGKRVRSIEKGNREHILMIPGGLLPYLDPYIADLSLKAPHLPLFRTVLGQAPTQHPLAYSTAHAIVRARAKSAGIAKEISPHSFRATAITALFDAGLDLTKVQTFANHARPDTTLLYHRNRKLTDKDRETISKVFAKLER